MSERVKTPAAIWLALAFAGFLDAYFLLCAYLLTTSERARELLPLPLWVVIPMIFLASAAILGIWDRDSKGRWIGILLFALTAVWYGLSFGWAMVTVPGEILSVRPTVVLWVTICMFCISLGLSLSLLFSKKVAAYFSPATSIGNEPLPPPPPSFTNAD